MTVSARVFDVPQGVFCALCANIIPMYANISDVPCSRVHNWRVVLVAYVFVVHVFAMTGHDPVCAIHCKCTLYSKCVMCRML